MSKSDRCVVVAGVAPAWFRAAAFLTIAIAGLSVLAGPSLANIAPLASATASSGRPDQGAAKAINGVIDGWPGDFSQEWATLNEGTGAWIQLDWSSPVTIDQVTLYDRPNLNDHITAATLSFSDGPDLPVGQLDNDGQGVIAAFSPREVTSLRLTVDGVGPDTQNAGLAEIEVLGVVSPDGTPPVISAVTVTAVTQDRATILWTTDEPSDSRVNYGTTTALGLTEFDPTPTTSHQVTLSGLVPSTPYFLEVQSSDPSGNTATDNQGGALYTFTTKDSTFMNVAPLALVSASSERLDQEAIKAVNGVVSGWPVDYTQEWATNVEGVGAWIQLDWTSPVILDQVILYDRPNFADHITAATLSFSDSSTVPVGPLDNGGIGGIVAFPSRSVTSMRLTVDTVGVDTQNVGLAELEVFGSMGPDLTSPVISDVTVSVVTQDTATITWITDEPADSRVNYGTTTGLGLTEFDATPTTSHQVTLSGLVSSTLHYFEVESVDSSGNPTTDDNLGALYEFTTRSTSYGNVAPFAAASASSQRPDQEAIKAVNGVVSGWPVDYTQEWATNVEGVGAWIQLDWIDPVTVDQVIVYDRPNLADQITAATLRFSDDSTVPVGMLDNGGSGVVVTFPARETSSLRLTVTGVSPESDNIGLAELEVFADLPADDTPPVISGVTVTQVTLDSATIAWTTDELSDSRANYGTTTGLGETAFDAMLTTNHEITVNGLASSTPYYFEVESTDFSGNTTTDDNGGLLYTFTTLGSDPAISNIQVSEITATSATVTWQTDIPVFASVERNVDPVFFLCPPTSYGPQDEPHYCTVWDTLLSTTPTIRLTALAPNTTYHLRVRSTLELAPGAPIFSEIAPFTFTTADSVGTPVDAQIGSSSDDAFDVPGDPLGYDDTGVSILAGSPTTNQATGGWRWTGLGLPATAVITEAWVEINQYGDSLLGFATALAFEDSASPVTFASASTPADRWTGRTTFEVNWSWPHAILPPSESWLRSPSLVAGVQELVDRYGAIDEIVLLEQGIDAPFYAHDWAAHDLGPEWGARLHIQYTDASDVTPPTISNVQVKGLTPDSATVAWTTNEPADSRVNYGTTPGLGSTEFDGTLTMNHQVTLTGLATETPYFFEVESADFNGNLVIDNNSGALYEFTTRDSSFGDITTHALASASSERPDQGAVKAVDGVVGGWPGDFTQEWATMSETTGAWIELEWPSPVLVNLVVLHDRPNLSDQITAATLTFSDGSTATVGALDNGGLASTVPITQVSTTSLRLTVDGASPSSANIGLAEIVVLGTLAVDETPPAISDVAVTAVSQDRALVTWTTDEPSDSRVNYGTTVGLGLTEFDATFTTTHAVTLTGLTSSTPYFFEVQSTDLGGNTATDDQGGAFHTFTTRDTSFVNVAWLGAVSASSERPDQGALKAINGVASGWPDDFTQEWATASEGVGAWIQLDWLSPVTVDHVILFDRPNLSDQITAATLNFSDGSTVAVGELDNDGLAVIVPFEPRTVDSLWLTVDAVGVDTLNVGLAEIEVYGTQD